MRPHPPAILRKHQAQPQRPHLSGLLLVGLSIKSWVLLTTYALCQSSVLSRTWGITPVQYKKDSQIHGQQQPIHISPLLQQPKKSS